MTIMYYGRSRNDQQERVGRSKKLPNREEVCIEEWLAGPIGTVQSNGDVSDSLCDLQAGNIYN